VPPVPEVLEHTEDIGGVPVFWRTAGDDEVPVLYVHGVPDNSDTWVPFLERGGGIAVDLLGFGRSAKRGDLDFTIAGYDDFIERFLAHVGVERVRLVVHDWGAAALAWAQRRPERVERLVVSDAVPLLPGYRWHRWARAWRTHGLGEVAMGLTLRWTIKRELPAQLVDSVWEHWDQGTQRAILHLYRASPPEALEAAGRDLNRITCPALVLWGDRDPYLDTSFAHAYADALGGDAEVEIAEGAGHWPWLDRPELVERIVAFARGL
jgi:pimeloyl-ACP methyl ester carboxylesterase